MTSIEEKEIRAFLTLNRLGIEGRRRVRTLLSEGKSAWEVVERMEAEDWLKGLPVSENAPPFNPEREIELCAQKKIDFLIYSDADYPALLKEVADPPLLLYKKGTLIEHDRNAIAIVGTRHPSFYGRTQAMRFSRELAASGLTIVSGLARGIDQVAHDGALHISYGRTIAVMGCGLDVIYPKENENLFQRILERGAVLSEYPLGMPPLSENFPRRNRILSGLSYATFVVEAHSRSGSLITAHQAAEQGREVFALPGAVDQLTSRGTHQLIKEGALLVETPEDILLALADRLKWENKFGLALPASDGEETGSNGQRLNRSSGHPVTESPQTQSVPDNPPPFELLGASGQEKNETRESSLLGDIRDIPREDESVVSEVLKEEGPLAQDEILEFTGFEPSKLPALLLRMELAGKIRKSPDGKYLLREKINGQRTTNNGQKICE